MSTPVWLYLASKEMWRNRGRFLLVSLVIALITLLVVFLAGLAEGHSLGNKEFLGKLGGELIVFQEQANLSLPSSQLGNVTRRKVQRVSGVADVGAIGFSSVFITNDGNQWGGSGILVVGGFFQTQTFQKVGQVGMLKALKSREKPETIQ